MPVIRSPTSPPLRRLSSVDWCNSFKTISVASKFLPETAKISGCCTTGTRVFFAGVFYTLRIRRRIFMPSTQYTFGDESLNQGSGREFHRRVWYPGIYFYRGLRFSSSDEEKVAVTALEGGSVRSTVVSVPAGGGTACTACLGSVNDVVRRCNERPGVKAENSSPFEPRSRV